MKAKVYLRVADSKNQGVRVQASGTRPFLEPFYSGYPEKPVPTVAFAIELDIPEAAFTRAAAVVAEIDVPEEAIEIAAGVEQ